MKTHILKLICCVDLENVCKLNYPFEECCDKPTNHDAIN